MKLQLSGRSMEELRERVRAEYGPEARIVSAESVTVGGIKGYFARRHFEVTVHVPSAAQQPDVLRVPSRAGIAALLEEADRAESGVRQENAAPAVSTGSGIFEEFVQGLAKTTGTAPESRTPVSRGAGPVPRPAMHPGDLTLVVGLGKDALSVALSMADHAGAAGRRAPGVYTGGPRPVDGFLSLSNRSGAMAARAAGVEGGYPIFVAWGIGSGWDMPVGGFSGLGADQVWVAIDARRKPADTAMWVDGVKAVVSIFGMAVDGADGTASPETVNNVGIPLGWLDGRPSLAPVL